MKKQFLAVLGFVLLSSVVSVAQTSTPAPKTENLWLSEDKHDFGKIPQGTPVYTWFELKGETEPLKLEMVQAGCGCTTPEFKAGTYASGEVIKIKVGFNAAAVGPFNKPVTIYYNDGKQKVIYITGEVAAGAPAPAPGNGNIAKIKL